MPLTLPAFIARWQDSHGPERGNMQLFLQELIQVLGLPAPEPTGPASSYCFEKQVPNYSPEGKFTKNYMDLYKAGCFILEAKRTPDKLRAKGESGVGGGGGKGRRPTVHAPGLPGMVEEPRVEGYRTQATYDARLETAFIQGIRYAMALGLQGPPPPFLIVCDIGHSFHIWNRYDPKAGGGYGGFGARRIIALDELVKPDIQQFFRDMWTNPQALDTSRRIASVTRGIATELGRLAQELRSTTRSKEEVAHFLMRCVFTCFAEDINLLPGKPFTEGLLMLEKEPDQAEAFLHDWWKTMDEGGKWGWKRVLRFNGTLFKDLSVPPLSQRQLALLRMAAEKDWQEVEPAIFGTLLESALDEDERHRLGAHYTPRAYIQRLVDATFGQSLREQWTAIEADLAKLLESGHGPEAVVEAKARLYAFHAELASLTFLDPACGSGNFLYVAFDTLKRLEGEVLQRLEDLGEGFSAFDLSHERISPAQFKGIELDPWAAGIAELVLWIAHLQWFRRRHPAGDPPEPVLQNYGSIEQRDAVLDWDAEEATGDSRWDGKTFKVDARGRKVPDGSAQVASTRLHKPRPAPWPMAHYIIGNPPFLGNASLLGELGVGYTEALRAAYPAVPDTVDFVLYWWHRAALEVREGRARRFGLITTNSLSQVRQRGVLAHHCADPIPVHPRSSPAKKEKPAGDEQRLTVIKNRDLPALKLLWAIPDHPWHGGGAAVRIAMTVGGLAGAPVLARVVSETKAADPEYSAEGLVIEESAVDRIHEDLSGGARVTETKALKANDDLCSPGMKLHGNGFIVTPEQWKDWKQPAVVHPYRNGRDLTDQPRNVMVIDLYGLTEAEVRKAYPAIYQHLLQTVKPEREQNNRAVYRDNWWLFGEPRANLRPALAGLPRYIATVETAKHRVFQFLDGTTLPDNMIIAIASDDAFHLGVLGSRIHVVWALAAGGLLEDRPRYNKTRCFDPFPFPQATEAQAIRELAEEIDAHRKRAQAEGVGLTAQYNLLDRLRSGEPLTAKEQALDAKALGSLLLDLHRRLDAAVAQAYGWPEDLPEAEILTRLVALNQARAAEEAAGTVRWLRPGYQTP